MVDKKKSEIKYVDGVSESLWKSVVVKSLRMGWPAGLYEAAKRLNKSTMKSLLLCGVFEDIFPAPLELFQCKREIDRLDFEALCRRETHHGKGLSDAFCDFEDEAVYEARTNADSLSAEARAWGLWLPPRALNCFYTWLKLRDEVPRDVTRPIDETPWTGIPEAMADSHTVEGRIARRRVTILSGHYSQHRELGRIVMEQGWRAVRAEVHSGAVIQPRVKPSQERLRFLIFDE